MINFDRKTLGFDYQLQHLASFAKSFRAKSELLNIEIHTDRQTIETLLEQLDTTLNMHRAYSSMPMSAHYEIFDLIQLMDKGHLLTLTEAFQVFQFSQLLDNMVSYENQVNHIIKEDTIFSVYPLTPMSTVHQRLIQTFNIEGQLLDDASIELYKVRKKLSAIDQRYVKSLQQALSQNQSILSDAIIVSRGDALCLAVTDSYKNQIKGIIHDVSQSGLTVYMEPMSSALIRQEKTSLLEEEKIAILEILKDISKLVSSQLEYFKTNMYMLLELDKLEAKTLFSKHLRLDKPQLNDAHIELTQAWHLELVNPVPITVYCHKDSHGLFITGPNTGGKTVTLKTIGLCQLMAQAGLFIPAKRDSKVMIFNFILADIGDDQSIINNLSTFSGHLKKHIDYLARVSKPSLILIDEIGSGTDPQEGVALAKSILDRYIDKQVIVVVTTHYQALKQYAIEKGFLLASVAFDKETLAPKYHIQMGMSGQSHAFDIAKRLGMDDKTLAYAENYYQSDQNDADRLLIELQKKTEQLQLLTRNLEHEQSVIASLKREIELEKKQFEKQKQLIVTHEIDTYKHEYQKKLDAIEQLMAEIASLDFKTQAKLKGSLSEIKQDVIPVKVPNASFFEGDAVFVKAYEQQGIIKKVLKHGYEVDLGKFTLTFKASDLSKHNMPNETKSTKPKVRNEANKKPAQTYTFELDLRGFRYEEVKPALDKAIDQALFSNQKFLRVIHGFGTGAVRNAVYDMIKKHPNIESYRYGMEGEGLNGVTIISFK